MDPKNGMATGPQVDRDPYIEPDHGTTYCDERHSR